MGDDDGSGLIEFSEFLTIVRDGYNDAVCRVFKQTMAGKLGDRNLSFPMLASTYRRRMLLEAMMGASGERSHERGKRIMNAFANQMREYKKRTVEEQRTALMRKARAKQAGSRRTLLSSSSAPGLQQAPKRTDHMRGA